MPRLSSAASDEGSITGGAMNVPLEALKLDLCSSPAYRFIFADDDIKADETQSIEIKQTHLSLVFLTKEHVFKVKKPVSFGFVDFSTLSLRLQACRAEIDLNRRLCPQHIYIGMVGIRRDDDTGHLCIDEIHEHNRHLMLEYAVHMKRLSDDDTLLERVRQGRIDADMLVKVAEVIASFHLRAKRSPHISTFGSYEMIAQNVNENFEQSVSHVRQDLVSKQVYDRVKALSLAQLDELKPVFERRIQQGFVADAHGDLKLEHVYILNHDKDVVVIDCIEFNERFRYSDVLCDFAFLYMDMCREGGHALAGDLLSAYSSASSMEDSEHTLHRLVGFYGGYRAIVRAKVSAMKAAEVEVSASDRDAARATSSGYWMTALTLLIRDKLARPALILVSGLPGTGKSTLASIIQRMSSEHKQDIATQWIRSDVVRKQGLAGEEGGKQRLYSAEVTQKTYEECQRLALEALWVGSRVVVDATFREQCYADEIMAAAKAAGAIVCQLICVCDRSIVKQRMDQRTAQGRDISDADWSVFQRVEKQWTTQPDASEARFTVRTELKQQAQQDVRVAFKAVGLCD